VQKDGRNRAQQRRDISALAGAEKGTESTALGSLTKSWTALAVGNSDEQQRITNKVISSKRQSVTGVVGPLVA
jgi:hypothetical protein